MKRVFIKYAILTVTVVLFFLLVGAFGSLIDGAEPLEEMNFTKGQVVGVKYRACRRCESHEIEIISSNGKLTFYRDLDHHQIKVLSEYSGIVNLYWTENWYSGKKLNKVIVNNAVVIHYDYERIKKFYYFYICVTIFSFIWLVILFYYFKSNSKSKAGVNKERIRFKAWGKGNRL